MGDAEKVVVLSNDTIERSVIGSVMRHNELYRQNRDMLISDFFHDENVKIFSAVKEIIDKGGIATPVTVTALMDDKGQNGNRYELQRMVALADDDTFVANIRKLEDYYKRNLARLYLLQCAEDAVKMGSALNETLDRAEKEMKGLSSGYGAESIVSAMEAMKRIRQTVHDVRDEKVSTGILTGYSIFDSNYGLHDDNLIIIAARTGVGKTALAMNIAANIARDGTGVAYYSSEMGVVELWSRVISYDMKMRSLDILHRKLSDTELDKINEVTENYSRYPLYIDEEASVQFNRMVRSIRTMVARFHVKVVMVDYLQIVRTTQRFDSETLRLAFIVRELKNLAKELHIIVVVLSQLNRVGAKDGTVSKFALRGSGEIEEAADIVVMIERPDADPNTKGHHFTGLFSWVKDTTNKALLKMDKGRSMGVSEYLVDFIPEYTLFVDNGYKFENKKQEEKEKEQDPLPVATERELPL